MKAFFVTAMATAAALLTACHSAAPSQYSSPAYTSAIPEGHERSSIVAQRVVIIKDFEEQYTGNLLVFFDPAQKDIVLSQAQELGFQAYYQYDDFDAVALSPIDAANAGNLDQVVAVLSQAAGVLKVHKEYTAKPQQ